MGGGGGGEESEGHSPGTCLKAALVPRLGNRAVDGVLGQAKLSLHGRDLYQGRVHQHTSEVKHNLAVDVKLGGGKWRVE